MLGDWNMFNEVNRLKIDLNWEVYNILVSFVCCFKVI